MSDPSPSGAKPPFSSHSQHAPPTRALVIGGGRVKAHHQRPRVGPCLRAAVPHVDDPKHVVVNGQPMEQRAFIEKYCIGKPDNETCIRVQNAWWASGAKSKTGVPRF